LILSSVVGIATAHTLFYTSINHLGVAISTGSQLLAPFLTFLWAFLFLGETLTLIEWVGGMGLVAGGLLLIRAQTALAPPSLDPQKAPIEPELSD
jgi:drug/metabolite transporter (DMT)-like permease